MKKKIIRYTSIVLGIFVLLIIYLSTVGIETEKFNNQIQNLVKQKNDKFDTSLKKVKLTLDPLNFKVKAKTIDAKITFNNKLIELGHKVTYVFSGNPDPGLKKKMIMKIVLGNWSKVF